MSATGAASGMLFEDVASVTGAMAGLKSLSGVRFAAAVKQDGKPLTGGYISLQSESHPVEFRKVELLNLVGCMDRKAKNYKTYFEKDDPAACRY